MITFSVLICTYNRHELLAQSLRALVDGTCEKPDEIVIVNGGDDRADNVVQSFINRNGVNVRLIKTVNKNPAASRNVGLPQCTGEIVALTDDDAEVAQDWVAQIKRTLLENPQAGAVGGMVIGSHPECFLSRLADSVTFPAWPMAHAVRTLPMVNIAYRREVLQKIGPLDEKLSRGEDVDYNWRVQQLGYEIWFDPAIKVVHHHRTSLRQFLYQHHMYGRAYYLVRRKWPKMYCVYPHQIKSLRDALKAVNFVAAAIYEPIWIAMHLPHWTDKLAALPVLFANSFGWRGGMLQQALLVRLGSED